ncbi:hypothetical protein CAPTEDRAFT_138117, partial [Capitella teleta]
FYLQFDHYNTGEICITDFKLLLSNPRFRDEMEEHKLELLEGKASEDGRTFISYQEFMSIITCKRSRSFKIACDQSAATDEPWADDLQRAAWRRARASTVFGRMVRRVAKEYLVDDRERQYYADKYTCCPPPLFIPAVSLIEIGFFVYYALEAGSLSTTGPVPSNSIFVYRPDKRIEVWRFLFYMLIHAGWVHLFFNLMVQILVGIPLEMVHGSLRIGAVYMAGVLAGSLGTSVFDVDAFLVGASGGVYALLAAHLANILLNYSEMELGILKLAAVFLIASADVGFAIWDRYTSKQPNQPVGYVAHLMGALAGLTIGLLVLKNFEQKLHVQVLWWVALGVYCVCMIFAILWNIFYY